MGNCVYFYATGKAPACVSSSSDPGWVVDHLDFICSIIFRSLLLTSMLFIDRKHTNVGAGVVRQHFICVFPLLHSCTNCLVLVVMTSPGQSWLASVCACLPGGLFVQALASQSDHQVELQQNSACLNDWKRRSDRVSTLTCWYLSKLWLMVFFSSLTLTPTP